jgi:hypothetical protein
MLPSGASSNLSFFSSIIWLFVDVLKYMQRYKIFSDFARKNTTFFAENITNITTNITKLNPFAHRRLGRVW